MIVYLGSCTSYYILYVRQRALRHGVVSPSVAQQYSLEWKNMVTMRTTNETQRHFVQFCGKSGNEVGFQHGVAPTKKMNVLCLGVSLQYAPQLAVPLCLVIRSLDVFRPTFRSSCTGVSTAEDGQHEIVLSTQATQGIRKNATYLVFLKCFVVYSGTNAEGRFAWPTKATLHHGGCIVPSNRSHPPVRQKHFHLTNSRRKKRLNIEAVVP